jgi:hypothetical protein
MRQKFGPLKRPAEAYILSKLRSDFSLVHICCAVCMPLLSQSAAWIPVTAQIFQSPVLESEDKRHV